jgi:hypothetical protein
MELGPVTGYPRMAADGCYPHYYSATVQTVSRAPAVLSHISAAPADATISEFRTAPAVAAVLRSFITCTGHAL